MTSVPPIRRRVCRRTRGGSVLVIAVLLLSACGSSDATETAASDRAVAGADPATVAAEDIARTTTGRGGEVPSASIDVGDRPGLPAPAAGPVTSDTPAGPAVTGSIEDGDDRNDTDGDPSGDPGPPATAGDDRNDTDGDPSGDPGPPATAGNAAAIGVVDSMAIDPDSRPVSPAPTTTTRPTTTSTRPTTTTRPPTTSTSEGPDGGRFVTLPPGANLPSGAECATRVRSAPETRSINVRYNETRGVSSHDLYPRVDGDFVGTTDEIIQWAACKWGIDEDVARAQVAVESWWRMTSAGDMTTNQEHCHPSFRDPSAPQCPESIGLMQVRFLYHQEAFENENAIRSSAYNVDYAFKIWRMCYNGELTWLNDVERGRQYAAGDLDGCLGVWFTGRWYVPDAFGYIDVVHQRLDERVWEQDYFING